MPQNWSPASLLMPPEIMDFPTQITNSKLAAHRTVPKRDCARDLLIHDTRVGTTIDDDASTR
jgi:hypothetical protein